MLGLKQEDTDGMVRGWVSAVRDRTPRKMPRYVAVPRGVPLLTGQEAFRKVVNSQPQTR